ncbi:hypothetical protein I7I53_07748 [Histoplasma capsulatum var. duboisii H88]|uniref:Uncharacterized protein n=1 Tax=Ajellomyces capsulatus (strain H88) TaxID=544711 RepID=A0A8A1LCR4_AJEC8|nr:hypothetical protein I7I53_07748 [Histoplasma capsulatum var. duboisii H88]
MVPNKCCLFVTFLVKSVKVALEIWLLLPISDSKRVIILGYSSERGNARPSSLLTEERERNDPISWLIFKVYKAHN